jgi:hypothetical protein
MKTSIYCLSAVKIFFLAPASNVDLVGILKKSETKYLYHYCMLMSVKIFLSLTQPSPENVFQKKNIISFHSVKL